jgi:hypothetical protein
MLLRSSTMDITDFGSFGLLFAVAAMIVPFVFDQ